MSGVRGHVARVVVAGVASLVAAAALACMTKGDWALVLPALALLSAAAVVGALPGLGAQLFSRAVWWSNLALGAVITVIGSGRERGWGVIMALACGLALLVVDRRRLAAASERAAYAPAAFRTWLQLLMVLALADAQTFFLFGFVTVSKKESLGGSGALLVLGGAAYVVGFVGLYRLQIWGALANLLTSVALGLLILSRAVSGLNGNVRTFLFVVCLAHAVLVAPLFVALAVKWRPPNVSPRLRGLGVTSIVVGFMLLAVGSYVAHGGRFGRW